MDFGTNDGKVELKKLQLSDLSKVESLYSACRIALAERGLDQWQDGYPNRDVIKHDLTRNCLWGDSLLSCVVVLNKDQDPQHNSISWSASDEESLFVHRVAVHPNNWGKGMGRLLMLEVESLAKLQNANCIRLDTYSLNDANMKFYKKLGYDQLEGEVFFQPHEAPFICFEKMI